MGKHSNGKDSIIGRLKHSFLVMSLAVAAIALAAICGLASTVYQFSTFYSAHNVSTVAQESMRDSQLVAKSIVSSFSTSDNALTQEYLDLSVSTLAEMQEEVAYMKEHHTGDLSPIEGYETTMNGGIETRKEIVELIENGEKAAAAELYFASYNSVLTEANEYLTTLAESADSIATAAYTKARAFAWGIAGALVILCVIILYRMLTTSSRLVKMFTTPIEELKRGMDELAKGALSFELTYDSDNELGELARDFRKTCNFLRVVIADMNRLLRLMANGDFAVHTECEEMYIGDFEGLLQSIRMMNRTLNQTLGGINDVSEQVASGSEQLAASAQSVAEGATAQAGAVEELQAVISNVLEHTHRSAQIAEDSYRKAKNYADHAQMAEKEVTNMVAVMSEITELSIKVGSIVENIEDIASQTNLLSLNASIEAARAGEAGRGFAVVAQQIGALADDSAKSALNTSELIENTIEKINTGTAAADTVANALEELIGGIAELAELSDGSKETSVEQEQAMEQIEQGIVHISEIVQSNSAASEESSAASQELSAHAVHLKDMLEQFQFRG